MRPLVSIIIPVYNADQFLERTLLSAQQQTYDNLEIIVVNDGSTDTSSQIAAKYAFCDPRIKTVDQRNSGVASARNAGLRCASGDYVAFLDADDIWHPTKIERQIEVLLASTDSTGWGSVYSLHRYIDVQDRVLQSGRFWSQPGDFITHLVTHRTECGSKILARRELAIAVGGYDTEMSGAEDFDFELKLIARFPMVVVPEYLVGYRVSPGNVSSDDARMERAARAVMNKHIGLNGVSRPHANWVFGQFYKDLFFASLKRRQFIRAFKAMIGLIWNDPVVASRVLLFNLPERAAETIVKRVRAAIGFNPPPRPLFYEISPHQLFKPTKATGRWDEKVKFRDDVVLTAAEIALVQRKPEESSN
jgi:glycosyltransferase involved in cell wall biosynthesis